MGQRVSRFGRDGQQLRSISALRVACFAAFILFACARSYQTPPNEPRRPRQAEVLVTLGRTALEGSQYALAARRFRRALAADSSSADAHVGLGEVELAARHLSSAVEHFQLALALDPDAAAAHAGLARVAIAKGDRAGALVQLGQALEIAPQRPAFHARLATLTGRAPPSRADSPQQAIDRAVSHPYDPAALLAAGIALEKAGEPVQARARYETVLWLADRAPSLARTAWQRLQALDPSLGDRRLVVVHLYADQLIRSHEGWRFQLRLLLANLSATLELLVAATLVPGQIGSFESAPDDIVLDAIQQSFQAQHARVPGRGVIAVLTGRPVPRRRGSWRRGQAEFLGRSTIVRVAPGEVDSPVFVHEALHLYGAVHMSPEIESIMNPSGDSMRLDVWNQRILAETRGRRFEAGDMKRDVFRHIDLRATSDAYRAALAANLSFRRQGILEAFDLAAESRVVAGRRAREAMALDSHLGDVTRFLALLHIRDGAPALGIRLLDRAALLYGPRTKRGRQAAQRARRLEEQLLQ